MAVWSSNDMRMHYRLIVEWWDAYRQQTVKVCNRVYKTRRGADRRLARYADFIASDDNYRARIIPLGYR